ENSYQCHKNPVNKEAVAGEIVGQLRTWNVCTHQNGIITSQDANCI
ncbi:21543_t:CDS:1, partial [Gigaspora rosea]